MGTEWRYHLDETEVPSTAIRLVLRFLQQNRQIGRPQSDEIQCLRSLRSAEITQVFAGSMSTNLTLFGKLVDSEPLVFVRLMTRVLPNRSANTIFRARPD